MAWFVAGVMLASLIATLYLQSKIKLGGEPGQIQGPTAGEGRPLGVLFGRREITAGHLVWYGRTTVGPADTTGGASYGASMHIVLCHGMLDSITAIKSGDKLAWEGIATANSVGLPLNTYLGHPDSSKDGVYGTFDFQPGQVNTVPGNMPGLASTFNSEMGMAVGPFGFGKAAIMTRGHVGKSPYLRPVSAVATRIHKRKGGDVVQWNNAKAEITWGADRFDEWSYKIQGPAATTDYSALAYDHSAWDVGRGGFGNAPAGWMQTGEIYGMPMVGTDITGIEGRSGGVWPNRWVTPGLKIWMRKDLGALPKVALGVRCWHDDSAQLWFNGTAITLVPMQSDDDPTYGLRNSLATIPASLIDADGPNVIAYKVTDGFDSNGNRRGSSTYIYAGLAVGPDLSNPGKVVGINPVCILYEAITDPYWSRNMQEADIDETSFLAAADTCYNERLALSFFWDRQGKIKDFIAEVLRHIDGVLEINRKTGKYTLTLLRSDYDVEDLIVLDQSNLVKVTNASRRTLGQLVNTVTIEYSATLRGDVGTVTVHDTGLIQEQGGVVSSKIAFMGIMDCYTAGRVAARVLKLVSSPLATYEIEANRVAASLAQGSPFVLNFLDVGAESPVLRVTAINVGNGVSNTVKLTAVEDAFYCPTQPHVAPAPIYWPPRALAPLGEASTKFLTAYTEDEDNVGNVTCVFVGAHTLGGNNPMLEGFTETEPGTFVCDSIGPVPDSWIDGVALDAYNTTGVSRMLGALVVAFFRGDTSVNGIEEKRQQVFRVTDVGGHYENYGTPEQTFVSTYFTLVRAAGFENNSDYRDGMTFYVKEGTEFGGGYLTLGNASVSLGATDLVWTFSATHTWTRTPRLLTAEQLTLEGAVADVVDLSLTCGSAGADFDGFPTKSGFINRESLPSGGYSLDLEQACIDAGSDGETRVGFKLYLTGPMGTKLIGTAIGPALTTTPEPSTISTSLAEQKAYRSDNLLMIPFVSSTTTGSVTVHIRVNSPARGTGLTVPFGPTPLLERAALEVASFADGIATVGGRAWSADVAVGTGGTLSGIASEGYEEGDVVTLTVSGGSSASPVTLEHGATVPDGALPLYLSSREETGITPPDVLVTATKATMQLQLKADAWHLIGGDVATIAAAIGTKVDVVITAGVMPTVPYGALVNVITASANLDSMDAAGWPDNGTREVYFGAACAIRDGQSVTGTNKPIRTYKGTFAAYQIFNVKVGATVTFRYRPDFGTAGMWAIVGIQQG